MTQEEILEYNKRCAQVVGLKRGWWISQEKPLTDDKKQWWDINGKTFLGTKVYYDKDLKFYSDWNWIMRVVEAIEKLDGWVQIDGLSDRKGCTIRFGEMWGIISQKYSGDKIEAVTQAINQFLIWHEQNK